MPVSSTIVKSLSNTVAVPLSVLISLERVVINSEFGFNKSVTEILIENNLGHRIFSQQNFNPDPIQLNDVVPVQINGPFFKKGDLFLSLRHLSMVILYRPSNNKIVKVIEGGFNFQSDVDIIDDKTISIYNNNVFLNHKNKQIISKHLILEYLKISYNILQYFKIFSNTFLIF